MPVRRRWGARLLAGLGITVAFAGVAVVLAADPTAPSPMELARSVTGEVGAHAYDEPCHRVTGATWACIVDANGSGLPIEYRVTMTETRCWRAERVHGPKWDLPRHADGCVDLADAFLSVF